jgi:hypothetical protein
MTETTTTKNSATIYVFPPRGRFANSAQPKDIAPAANTQAPRAALVVAGSGWYHDAAIQAESQAQRGRTN